MNFNNFSQIFRGDRRIGRIYLGDELVWVEGAAPPAAPAPTISLAAVPANPQPGQTVTVTATITNAVWQNVVWSTTGPALSGSALSRSYLAVEGMTEVSATVTTTGGAASASVTVEALGTPEEVWLIDTSGAIATVVSSPAPPAVPIILSTGNGTAVIQE